MIFVVKSKIISNQLNIVIRINYLLALYRLALGVAFVALRHKEESRRTYTASAHQLVTNIHSSLTTLIIRRMSSCLLSKHLAVLEIRQYTYDMAPIRLDGRTGEGGGQLVRMAISLASLTSQPVSITNIRGNRPSGGGMPFSNESYVILCPH